MIRSILNTLPAALVLLASCAKQTSPTGGPKDEIPPKLLSSTPAPKELNFEGKTITLEFDEWIQVNNAREQVLITPAITGTFEMLAKKKTVVMKFDESFNDTTTYTINFRESIQDVTERNPAENLQLAFSTGPYIDSLSLAGTIRDLLKGTPLKDISVALYQSDTFNIFEDKPIYLTKSNENGEFRFENLKHGDFSIYGFNDKNKNLLVDSKSEAYAFLSNPIALHHSIDSITLSTVNLDARPLALTSARPYNTYFNIKTNKLLAEYSIASPNDTTPIITAFGEDRANIRVFNANMPADSTLIRLQASDSIQNKIDTTLYIKFATRKTDPEKYTVKVDAPQLILENGTVTTTIQFSKPSYLQTTDSLLIIYDSASNTQITNDHINWNATRTEATLTIPIDKSKFQQDFVPPSFARNPRQQKVTKPDTITTPITQKAINVLHAKAGTFISIENDSTQKIQQKLTVLTPQDLGVIRAEVHTDQPHFLLQLLDKTGKVLQTSIDTPNHVFTNLTPQDYQLRLIIDTNNNQRWDPGNFHTRTEPEPSVFYFSFDNKTQAITIKANWDVGPLLITY